jgi:hypothetical protein
MALAEFFPTEDSDCRVALEVDAAHEELLRDGHRFLETARTLSTAVSRLEPVAKEVLAIVQRVTCEDAAQAELGMKLSLDDGVVQAKPTHITVRLLRRRVALDDAP